MLTNPSQLRPCWDEGGMRICHSLTKRMIVEWLFATQTYHPPNTPSNWTDWTKLNRVFRCVTGATRGCSLWQRGLKHREASWNLATSLDSGGDKVIQQRSFHGLYRLYPLTLRSSWHSLVSTLSQGCWHERFESLHQALLTCEARCMKHFLNILNLCKHAMACFLVEQIQECCLGYRLFVEVSWNLHGSIHRTFAWPKHAKYCLEAATTVWNMQGSLRYWT